MGALRKESFKRYGTVPFGTVPYLFLCDEMKVLRMFFTFLYRCRDFPFYGIAIIVLRLSSTLDSRPRASVS